MALTTGWRQQHEWSRDERRMALKLHLMGYSVNEIARDRGDWWVRFGGQHAGLLVSSDTTDGIVANVQARE
jgi:hypothetical protein